MIVADASVVVDLVLGAGSEGGDTLADGFQERTPVCAPHLIDAEVAQALRRYVSRREVSAEGAGTMLDNFLSLPIRRYAHAALVRRAFEFRENATIYDGLYLALAEAIDSPLLTGDAALRGVPGCRAVVEVLETAS